MCIRDSLGTCVPCGGPPRLPFRHKMSRKARRAAQRRSILATTEKLPPCFSFVSCSYCKGNCGLCQDLFTFTTNLLSDIFTLFITCSHISTNFLFILPAFLSYFLLGGFSAPPGGQKKARHAGWARRAFPLRPAGAGSHPPGPSPPHGLRSTPARCFG